MNFDQVVIREFLKLNPGFTDTPDLIAQKRVGNFFTGAVNFPRTEEAAVTGGKVVKANVPDLAALFKNITPSIEIYKPTTNRDVAKVLFEKYGIIADINDITPTAIVYDPLPLEVEIVAPSASKTITGKVKVKLSQKVMDLTEIVTAEEYVCLVDEYPTTSTQFIAHKWAYGNDYTLERETLKAIAVYTGPYYSPHAATFLRLLNDPRWCSPVEWANEHKSRAHPYNVTEPLVPYNGPTSGLPGANTAYTHVLQVWLGYAGGITPKSLMLHYDWRP